MPDLWTRYTIGERELCRDRSRRRRVPPVRLRMYTTMTKEKQDWPDGPWQNEPDKLQWTDQQTGLPCLIKRNRMGALCGYVGVSEGHPWFGKDYDYDMEPYPDVHGGITYGDLCEDDAPEAIGICHVPAPGEPDRVWWLGFDCAHSGDLIPGLEWTHREVEAKMREEGHIVDSQWRDVYRDVAYVRHECEGLARQAINQGRTSGHAARA